MQLFTLAGLFFSLAAFTVALERTGPCTQDKLRLGQEMPGKFVPRCTQFGFYEPLQCHGSTGYCWCVNPDNGQELQGSRVPPGSDTPQCPACHKQRAAALRAGLVGGYAPQCDEYGMFMPTQHHGSTGQSWCVDKFTGEVFEETRTMPGQPQPDCSGSRYCHKNDTEGKPCCQYFFQESSSIYRLECTRNGYFKTEQSVPFADVPTRFCVNPATGILAQEARFPNCGGCFKYIEDKLGAKQPLGSELPRCLDHTGDYAALQKSHDGYRWCVNYKTGAVESEKRRLDDKTPLPCELM